MLHENPRKFIAQHFSNRKIFTELSMLELLFNKCSHEYATYLKFKYLLKEIKETGLPLSEITMQSCGLCTGYFHKSSPTGSIIREDVGRVNPCMYCPLYKVQNKRCGDKGSIYSEFVHNMSIENTGRIVNVLRKIWLNKVRNANLSKKTAKVKIVSFNLNKKDIIENVHFNLSLKIKNTGKSGNTEVSMGLGYEEFGRKIVFIGDGCGNGYIRQRINNVLPEEEINIEGDVYLTQDVFDIFDREDVGFFIEMSGTVTSVRVSDLLVLKY